MSQQQSGKTNVKRKFRRDNADRARCATAKQPCWARGRAVAAEGWRLLPRAPLQLTTWLLARIFDFGATASTVPS